MGLPIWEFRVPRLEAVLLRVVELFLALDQPDTRSDREWLHIVAKIGAYTSPVSASIQTNRTIEFKRQRRVSLLKENILSTSKTNSALRF